MLPTSLRLKAKILNSEVKISLHPLLASSLFTWLQSHWTPSYLLNILVIPFFWTNALSIPSAWNFLYPDFKWLFILLLSGLGSNITLWDLSWLLCGKLQRHSHFLFFILWICFSISLNHLQVHHIIYILRILFIFYFFSLKHKLQEDSDLWLSGLLLYTSTQIFTFENEWLTYQINETEVIVFVIETPILFSRVLQEI